MKKNILKLFVLTFSLTVIVCASMNAQNFVSKPQAIKNLSDEAKHIANTLPSLQENDLVMYKVNKEKLRFIKSMLKGLKGENTLEATVSNVLPKQEWNKLSPSVRFIDTSFSNLAPNQYIRQEVLYLITY